MMKDEMAMKVHCFVPNKDHHFSRQWLDCRDKQTDTSQLEGPNGFSIVQGMKI
jgi:hypothetical protein